MSLAATIKTPIKIPKLKSRRANIYTNPRLSDDPIKLKVRKHQDSPRERGSNSSIYVPTPRKSDSNEKSYISPDPMDEMPQYEQILTDKSSFKTSSGMVDNLQGIEGEIERKLFDLDGVARELETIVQIVRSDQTIHETKTLILQSVENIKKYLLFIPETTEDWSSKDSTDSTASESEKENAETNIVKEPPTPKSVVKFRDSTEVWKYDDCDESGVLHWEADDIVFKRMPTIPATPRRSRRKSSFDVCATVVKTNTRGRNSESLTEEQTQNHEALESFNSLEPTEFLAVTDQGDVYPSNSTQMGSLDMLVEQNESLSPEQIAENVAVTEKKGRRGRRASVGGRHIKHLNIDVSSIDSEDLKINDESIQQLNDTESKSQELISYEDDITSDMKPRDKDSGKASVSVRRSTRRKSLSARKLDILPFLDEIQDDEPISDIPIAAITISSVRKDASSCVMPSSPSVEGFNVLAESDIGDLCDLSDLNIAKEDIRRMGHHKIPLETINSSNIVFIYILAATKSKLIELDYNNLCRTFTDILVLLELEERDCRKGVSFRQFDGSCVSPPNDRRPSSWESSFQSLSKYVTIHSELQRLTMSQSISRSIDKILAQLRSESALIRLKEMVPCPRFSIDETKSIIRILSEEISMSQLSQDIPESYLLQKISWMATSIVRFHLRWLLDPIPADISVAAVASMNISNTYRSDFHMNNAGIYETLLKWFELMNWDSDEDDHNIPDTWSKKPTDSSDITVSFLFTTALNLFDYSLHFPEEIAHGSRKVNALYFLAE